MTAAKFAVLCCKKLPERKINALVELNLLCCSTGKPEHSDPAGECYGLHASSFLTKN